MTEKTHDEKMAELEENDRDEINLWEQWKKEAWEVSPETLPDFIAKLINHPHGYGTICNAMAAAAIATCVAMDRSEQGGITGFQASAIGWRFLEGWNRWQNDRLGHKMLDYDRMMYPQYDHEFRLSIPEDVWRKMQEKAREFLFDNDTAHPDVIEHWAKIAAGIPPFGAMIEHSHLPKEEVPSNEN